MIFHAASSGSSPGLFVGVVREKSRRPFRIWGVKSAVKTPNCQGPFFDAVQKVCRHTAWEKCIEDNRRLSMHREGNLLIHHRVGKPRK